MHRDKIKYVGYNFKKVFNLRRQQEGCECGTESACVPTRPGQLFDSVDTYIPQKSTVYFKENLPSGWASLPNLFYLRREPIMNC